MDCVVDVKCDAQSGDGSHGADEDQRRNGQALRIRALVLRERASDGACRPEGREQAK